jgi:small subunit ribosomal protein S2
VVADAVADGLIARSGAAVADEKPTDDQFTTSDEPLPEWELDLLEGAPAPAAEAGDAAAAPAAETPEVAEAVAAEAPSLEADAPLEAPVEETAAVEVTGADTAVAE